MIKITSWVCLVITFVTLHIWWKYSLRPKKDCECLLTLAEPHSDMPLNWIGLHLFNDDTRPQRHISHLLTCHWELMPLRINEMLHTLTHKNYSHLITSVRNYLKKTISVYESHQTNSEKGEPDYLSRKSIYRCILWRLHGNTWLHLDRDVDSGCHICYTNPNNLRNLWINIKAPCDIYKVLCISPIKNHRSRSRTWDLILSPKKINLTMQKGKWKSKVERRSCVISTSILHDYFIW